MAAITAYQKIPVPGFVSPTGSYIDPEILYSTVGFTQKGVTIASGQGVLAAGTVIAMKMADKKYYAYNGSAAGTGLDAAKGVLRRGVDTGTVVNNANDQLGNMVIAGILKLDQLVGLDSGAESDLGMIKDIDRNTAKF